MSRYAKTIVNFSIIGGIIGLFIGLVLVSLCLQLLNTKTKVDWAFVAYSAFLFFGVPLVCAFCSVGITTCLYIFKFPNYKTEATAILTEWAEQKGHDNCWYYPEVFKKLCDLFGVTVKPQNLPPKAEFEAGCKKYQDDIYRE